ncbi:MAG: hypothetical protein M0Z29_09185, partial [Actinomycetota bacterium]|nr:hypothetical protein [Actinomycetota bacterium]
LVRADVVLLAQDALERCWAAEAERHRALAKRIDEHLGGIGQWWMTPGCLLSSTPARSWLPLARGSPSPRWHTALRNRALDPVPHSNPPVGRGGLPEARAGCQHHLRPVTSGATGVSRLHIENEIAYVTLEVGCSSGG